MRRFMISLAAIGLMAVTAAPANAQGERVVFDGNILWNNSGGNYFNASGTCSDPAAGGPFTYTIRDLGNTYFANNDSVNPGLHANLYNIDTPRWDPQPGSPALCQSVGQSTIVQRPDPWFDKALFIGAIPPRNDPSEDWTTGWTYYNNAGGAGRTDINYTKPVVILQGPQASQTLTTANNYLLRGKVNVAPGHTLTINAGVVLFGEFATTGYLVIDRGAKIMALGTRDLPIILTSSNAPGSMAPGDNGGLVIHGRAIANCANTAAGDSCVSEGGAGAYGGGDDDDDSGVVRYMRIEYSGKEIAINNELNSLTMNAVGRNTKFEFIQAHQGSDDSFEWFGGTARCKYLIATGQQDDGLDWQMGFRGFVQFAVSQMHPNTGDKGIEADNNEFNFNAINRSNPVFSNLTLVGTNPPTPGAGSTNIGVHLRRGTAGTILNSIIVGFRGPGLRLENPETFANCPGPQPAVACTPGVTAVEASETTLPSKLRALAYPNPASGPSNLSFQLASDRRVKIQIFDVNGRLVETLVDRSMGAGAHTVPWAPRGSQTGNYYFRVSTEDGQAQSGKITYVK